VRIPSLRVRLRLAGDLIICTGTDEETTGAPFGTPVVRACESFRNLP